MSTQNYRRSAAGLRGTQTFNHAGHDTGSQERKRLLPSLQPHESQLVQSVRCNCAGMFRGMTEAGTFMVFHLQAKDKGMRAQETDTCPLLEVVELGSAGDANDRGRDTTAMFSLPLLVCHDTRWLEATPKFYNWLWSSAYFPTVTDTNTLRPSDGTRKTSDLDNFRLYVGALFCTIGKLWATGSSDAARNVVLLNHSVQGLKKMFQAKMLPTQTERLHLATRLENLLATRDSSADAARAYITLEQETHPADFYWCLFNLMQSHSRQQVVGLWNLLLGVLTQDMLPSDVGVTLAGLSDHWLRLVWERIAHAVPTVNLADCFTEEDLIKAAHTRCGKKAENHVKLWAFVLAVLRDALTPFYTQALSPSKMEKCVKHLLVLRGQYHSVEGLTTASLAISPSMEHCLTERSMAEVILTAAERTRKTTELLDVAALFDQHADTPLLTAQLSANREAAAKVKGIADKALANCTKTDDFSGCLDAFLPPHVSHAFTTANTLNYLVALVSLARDVANTSDKQKMGLVQALVQKAAQTGVLGTRRSRAALAFLLPRTSVLYNTMYLPEVHAADKPDRRVAYIERMLAWGSAMPKQLRGEVQVATDEHDPEMAIPILFVRMEEAVARVTNLRNVLDVLNAEVDRTCPVCMEAYDDRERAATALHDGQHPICAICVTLVMTRFRSCPLCRKTLSM